MDIRWDVHHLSGGTEATFHTNTSIEAMVATGDGSATMKVLSNPTHIVVEALVVDPGGSTSTGVTVRRADSGDRISLVRVWGTTDGYELRQGTTVLEAFTATGATWIRLKIVDAMSGTTDVECYVNDVLVHTETGVSFTLPDVLHLGMICEDGGQWNWIHFSPCPPEVCVSSVTCTGVKLPVSWTFSGGSISGSGACAYVAGTSDWILLHDSKVMGTCNWDADLGEASPLANCLDGFEAGWRSVSGGCTWSSVFPTPFLDGYPDLETGLADSYEGSWPVRQDRADGTADAYLAVANSTLSYYTTPTWTGEIEIENNGTELDPLIQVRVKVLGQIFANFDPESDPPILFGLYYSDWYDLSHDFTAEDLEVDLDSSDACTFPATLTLSPNGNLPLARQFSGCDEPGRCTPFINEQSLVFVGMLPDGDVRVCMSRAFDQDTGVAFWTGTTANVYGTCVGGVLLTGTVRCGELQEGAITQWLFDLETPEGTFTMPLENITDPFSSADVADTIDLCTGETSLPMVGTIEPCEEPVFEACCDDEIGCCSIQIQATGEIVDPNDPCTITNCVGRNETLDLQTGAIVCTTTTTPISPTGWDHTKQYYRGSVPISAANPDIFSGHSLLVYCGGGAVRWATIDADGCATDSGVIADWDCETRTGTIDLTAYPTADCCDGFGAGSYRITLNG